MTDCYALHLGQARTPLAHAVRDKTWPGMWRLHWPDGRISDMANLTRCKDAGGVIAGGKQGSKGFRWKLAARSSFEGAANVSGQLAHALILPAGTNPPSNSERAV